MIAVWVPLLAPLILAVVFRLAGPWRLEERMRPRLAVWVLTISSMSLAVCTVVALVVLLVAGLLQVPAMASVVPIPPGITRWLPVGVWPFGSCLAGALLLGMAGGLLRVARRHRSVRREAWARAVRYPVHGDVTVVPDVDVDAYALPGRPGRVIITGGMLRHLRPCERRVLLAHERSHLRHGHHRFLLAAELAAACHPPLRSLGETVSYCVERWADEDAAAEVGDRALAAKAIGRAALTSHTRHSAPLARIASGPVPRRVAALLDLREADPMRGLCSHLTALVLVSCLAVSAAGALDATTDLQEAILAAPTAT
ncbi:M48 family metalloprotease [Actinoallomurus liliacearum]|uniref:M48 family metalloprotease n=1 Tax=Actinoallomurus liliacearum TaxID=1080073 RepID=A0ABP8TVP9_9ACTN